jgi:hypothetical protein
MEKGIGAPIVQPVYLTPGSSRFVQFHPFVEQERQWQVRWGRGGKENLTIDGPKLAGPARVLLCEPESPLLADVRLKIFPDDLFPTTVSATDGLDAVVLDHVPRWESVRREAFLDWVRQGGVVHLLKGSKGEFPEFTAELAALNGTADKSRIGSGTVYRHAAGRDEMTGKFLDEHGSPEREMRQGKNISIYGFDQSSMQGLAALTRPEIAWWFIYLLAAGYVFVIGPGHYIWSKKRDYRVAIAVLIGVVALFGFVFAWAGRRGVGETQRAHSISIAHSLEGNRYDVMQWNNAFVTKGALYRLTHAAPANFYSVGGPSTEQNIAGRVQNGRDGVFEIDLPLYSSQPFMHRAVMQGEPTQVTPVEWKVDANGDLSAFAFKAPEGFPKKIEAIYARHNGRIFQLEPNALLWRTNKPGRPETEFFGEVTNDYFSRRPFGERPDEEKWMKGKLSSLMARDLGGAEKFPHLIPSRRLGADELQLFIFAGMPDGFRLQGGNFKSELGWVLYVQTVSKID